MEGIGHQRPGLPYDNGSRDRGLRHGGDKLVIDGGREEEAIRERLARWPENLITETDTGYIIDLIVPDGEGEVHEDLDDRTPLPRITCPTCVERIAHKRIERREDAFGDNLGPGKSPGTPGGWRRRSPGWRR